MSNTQGPILSEREEIPASLGKISHVLYGLLTSMLNSRAFSYRTHPHCHMCLEKQFLCSHILSIIIHLELD